MINDLDMLWLPLVTFAFTACVTPGPNNIMLLASGVNFGFKRSMPQMFGTALGMMALVLVIALGLGELFDVYPALQQWLKYLGCGYLFFLAWKIASAGKVEDREVGSPISFLQAGLFQFVNIKGVLMVISSIGVFALPGENYALSALAIGLVFAMVALPSTAVWAAFGASIRRFLDTDSRLKAFNYTMAALTVATMAMLFI